MLYDGNTETAETENDEPYWDEQDARIINILYPEQAETLDDLPEVNEATLQVYYEYLKTHLSKKCTVTGRESVGYFSWEERFEWGQGSQAEYKKLKKTRGSYQDKYQLLKLLTFNQRDGIIVAVRRSKDGAWFEIPLGDLEVVDESHASWQLIEDYGMWICNYND